MDLKTRKSKKARAVKSYRKHAKNKGNSNNDNDDNGKGGKGNSSSNGPRYIVFFLDGVSYSEIKSCYEFSKKNDVDIFVGSTLIYSPQQYLKCFQKNNENDEQKGDE